MTKRVNYIILTLAILTIPSFALAQGMINGNNAQAHYDGHDGQLEHSRF